ncbi:MAG TPA: Atrophin-1 multi-domain protein [Aromatoleum sp.]|uniref:Atrophin-1 multi-domain protein n=1 Tax=Aromatoleum sp. TaxID=2307007 RepID=UPI002B47AFC9|nr:Atrophin-1 multi-domain protein [Aromatoleum sp.]HJV27119.1 Atrophin-1 multi-domain protein [Aromatoleum sp.]
MNGNIHESGLRWGALLGIALALVAVEAAAQPQWGSYLTPFSANSPWNSRPVNPQFSSFVIPKASYYPAVAEGAWSTGMFLAEPNDPPVTIVGPDNSKGVWDPDAETYYPSITIPHWPIDVVPASAADGHADVVDPTTGIIHSFYRLSQNTTGQWVAKQYAWTRIDGRGWGTPAHYMQGARAVGVATSGGLMRKHEINDGQTMYNHALAMSLTYSGLAPNPTYVAPATAADSNAASTNTGQIPEGSLVMLPPSFDVRTINTAALRKVAETLKTYGAYVVDRNSGTPYVIYVENGSGFNLNKGGWNSTAAADLERIRVALRQVVSVDGWLDGAEQSYTPDFNLNRLSMRGTWTLKSGTVPGAYDTWQQAVAFPATATPSVAVNTTNRGLHSVLWALPAAGQPYRFRAVTTGGALLRMKLLSRSTGALLFDSKDLANGQTADFAWPAGNVNLVLTATSGVGDGSSAAGELLRVVQ